MENLPLQVKLRKESHRKVAYVQDLIVKGVYNVLDKAVLHGGTGIWRCYQGKRFSEDLDFYFSNDKDKINLIFENLKNIGFVIKKKKISNNSVYSELEYDRVFVRLEATFQKINGILCDYELSDGNFISIYSLSAEDYVKEKVNTYLKRFKIRDLWDIFFLLRNVENVKEIEHLISNYKKPIDEEDLKIIILEGIVPSSMEMIEYIKVKWKKRNI